MRETQVRSLGREDPLEKAMAPHSSTLAWKIPWMEEPGGLQSMGSLGVGHDWATSLLHTDLCIHIYIESHVSNHLIILKQGRMDFLECYHINLYMTQTPPNREPSFIVRMEVSLKLEPRKVWFIEDIMSHGFEKKLFDLFFQTWDLGAVSSKQEWPIPIISLIFEQCFIFE